MNISIRDIEENTHDEIAKLAMRDSREEVRAPGAELRSAVDAEQDSSEIVEAIRKAAANE